MIEPCQHVELQFNSGDYYLTCHVCQARWARIATKTKRFEYFQLPNGEWVGACPEEANQGFSDVDQYRRRRKE